MKRIFAVLAAAMLVFGVAGNAMAFFDNTSDLVLVAWEGVDPAAPGNEVYYDLGNFDGSELPTTALDTGISLSDFTASSWSNITIGLVGGDATTKVFGSDAGANAIANLTEFDSGQIFMFYGPLLGATGPKVTGTKGAFGDYSGSFNPFVAGLYTGNVTPTDFATGAETQKAEVLMGVGSYDMGIWAGGQASDATLLGTLSMDTTGGSLVIEYAPVPVPAAVWLLGSGLLGLIGIRRRNA